MTMGIRLIACLNWGTKLDKLKRSLDSPDASCILYKMLDAKHK